ncbi:MAG TPA: RNA polymerase sigma factor [Rhizomicrobium sp.]|jgi:RNA polymerase sigma factor (sigma-70 family)
MTENTDPNFGNVDPRMLGAVVAASDVDAWFQREVLPLEPALMQYLQHNWRNKSDIADLRQDIYVQVFEAALQAIPASPKPFLFTTARNLLIRKMRREQIVSIEAVSDVEALESAADAPGPERTTIARDELRKLQSILDQMPPRSREAFMLQQIDGLSRKEIALRMGINDKTVKGYLQTAGQVLADLLFGDPADLRRKA